MSSAVAANALAWRLACRLFSHGQPVLEATLSAAERALLHRLRGLQAVTAQTVDLRDALCPYCQLERGEVVRANGGLLCRCPDCGPVCLEAEDWRAWQFDPVDG